jgi:hypothetical protein
MQKRTRADRWALRVVWTGFSPLRCFLWAAFKAEVLHQIPTGTTYRGQATALLELPDFRVWVRLSSVATHPYRRHALQVPPVSAVCFRSDVLCDAQRQRSRAGAHMQNPQRGHGSGLFLFPLSVDRAPQRRQGAGAGPTSGCPHTHDQRAYCSIHALHCCHCSLVFL